MASSGRRVAIIIIAFGMVAAACGSSSDDTTTTTAAAATTTSTSTTVATTTTAEASGAVSTLKGVQGAVVRIVREGSFVDPEYGEIHNSGGSGSGFIIDPSGIAVTNNHVVTGAAFLQVYLDGEDEPRNAKILGVSECSDLAVIDIDGAGFPYLEWYDGPIEVGTEIYVAGFPAGDPQYALVEGIVSKAKSHGDTNWASVDYVIEHTAPSQKGNSGGPVITPDGLVLGIDYAGTDISNNAISRDEADRVLPDLIAGNNVNSIGVNGYAFATESLSGIWVSAVESGSPVANVGVKGGDIITELEGLLLATDATMADYCDILRSHESTDPLAIEVLRFDSEEVLEGTLNGEEELALAFSFAEELSDDVGETEAPAAYEYVQVWDDADLLTMQIPSTWTDMYGGDWAIGDQEAAGNGITAAPSIQGFQETWTTPGVFFGATGITQADVTPGEFLDYYQYFDECAYDGRSDYSDPLYSGSYDVWLDCGGTDSDLVVVEAYPEDNSYLVLVQVQVVSDADLDALDVILDTFEVVLE